MSQRFAIFYAFFLVGAVLSEDECAGKSDAELLQCRLALKQPQLHVGAVDRRIQIPTEATPTVDVVNEESTGVVISADDQSTSAQKSSEVAAEFIPSTAVETENTDAILVPPRPSVPRPTIMEEMFIDTLTDAHPDLPDFTVDLRGPAYNLARLCQRYWLFARRFCRGEYTREIHVEQCRAFFDDCTRHLPGWNPVDDASQTYQQYVRYGYGGFPFQRPL